MRYLRAIITLAICILAVQTSGHAKAVPEYKYVEFDKGSWTFSCKGSFEGRYDRRNLFLVRHPWTPGLAGDSGQIDAQATIPLTWKPPFALHFYVSDDYLGNAAFVKDPGWRGYELYQGHRFKQVLINNQIVWESDVADDVPPQTAVDMTRYVKPGEPFHITLRVLDKVGTAESLPGDAFTLGDYDGHVDMSGPHRFMTDVWWGDIALREQDPAVTPMKTRLSPNQEKFAAGKQGTFSSIPLSTVYDKPIMVSLEGADSLPDGGFPVTCGIPLAFGKVKTLNQVGLVDAHGASVPVQLETLDKWQDGSLRCVLFDFIAKPGTSQYRLVSNRARRSSPKPKIRIHQAGNIVRIDTGAQVVELGGNSDVLIDRVLSSSGGEVTSHVSGRMMLEQDGMTQDYHPRWDTIQVTANGPIRATVELRGQLAGPGPSPGRFVLRLNAYAGQRMLKMSYRVFNDTAHKLKVRDLTLTIPHQFSAQPKIAWDDVDKKRNEITSSKLELRQTTAEAYSAHADAGSDISGRRASGWVSVSDTKGTMLVAVKNFWQQFPKAFSVDSRSVEVGLFFSTTETPCFEQGPGEAKSHEIVLYFDGKESREDIGRVARSAARPLRLFSADWFCASGAFGPAYPHSDPAFSALTNYVKGAAGDVSPERLTMQYGIRNFGDMRYSLEPKHICWCNNYYDAMRGCFSEYLMSGDTRWFDRGEESAQHVMDIDQNHNDANKPGDVGGVHDCYSVNHSEGSTYWWAMQRQCAGFAEYYKLTGDPDAKEAMIMLADYLVRNNIGIGAGSGRDHTGPFYSLVWAYDETRDPKYLQACRKIVEDLKSGKVIVPRRGTYAELHANWNYIGGIPWFAAQLSEPLYLYYRLSGDADAAQILIGLCDSLVEESMTPGSKGDFYGYSFSPRFVNSDYSRRSNYNVILSSALLYAWNLTGDRDFLEDARGAYQITAKDHTINWITNCYWNVPTMTYFLHQEDIKDVIRN